MINPTRGISVMVNLVVREMEGMLVRGEGA